MIQLFNFWSSKLILNAICALFFSKSTKTILSNLKTSRNKFARIARTNVELTDPTHSASARWMILTTIHIVASCLEFQNSPSIQGTSSPCALSIHTFSLSLFYSLRHSVTRHNATYNTRHIFFLFSDIISI